MPENSDETLKLRDIKMPAHCANCGSPVVKSLVHCSFCEMRFDKDLIKQICTAFLTDRESEMTDDGAIFFMWSCLLLISPFFIFLPLIYIFITANLLINVPIAIGLEIAFLIIGTRIKGRSEMKVFNRRIAPQIHRFIKENHLSMNELRYIGDAALKDSSPVLNGIHRLNDKEH